MSHFYTRDGDDGFTGLLGEGRVPKSSDRLEAVGTLDEATATLGLARASCKGEAVCEVLLEVQRDLYHVMAEVAATAENAERFRVIDQSRVNWLEGKTDTFSRLVEIPKEFVVPGDSSSGAALALARTVVRRAERRVVKLLHTGELENFMLASYLNRLSSLCFVLELFENKIAGLDRPTLVK